MATIKDVALKAGVSPGTVSNCLSGRRPVSSEARGRIMAAIQELGYFPDAIARSLVTGDSRIIGVVTAHLDDYGASRLLTGIDAAAVKHGYAVLLTVIHNEHYADIEAVISRLNSHRVAGIIWAVPEHWHISGHLSEHYQTSIPPILALLMNPDDEQHVVNYDIRAGAQQAMRHLLDGGRKRIAHIAGPNTWDSNLRTIVWREMMTERGLPCDDTWVCAGDWSVAHGERAMRSLLTAHSDLDAVLAGNDHIALGAMNVLQVSGKRIPADVAVTGFDDIPEARYFSPPLSTVGLPFAELGSVALERVLDLIHAQAKTHARHVTHPPHEILMPVRFVRRQSA